MVLQSVFSQSTGFIFGCDASTVLRVPLFKRPASFAYIKLVAELASKLVHKEPVITFKRGGHMITRIAVIVFSGFLRFSESLFKVLGRFAYDFDVKVVFFENFSDFAVAAIANVIYEKDRGFFFLYLFLAFFVRYL